jgi:ABC-2 type transport system permease protein
MSKIGIIIRREYLSRVTKKMFLLTTLGLPILMLGFSFLTGYLASSTAEKLNIAVVDESGIFVNNLWDSSSNKSFAYFNAGELNTIKNTFIEKKFDMLLHISNINQQIADSSTIKVYSDGSISSDANNYLEDRLNTVYQNRLMLDAGISRKSIDSFQQVSLHCQYCKCHWYAIWIFDLHYYVCIRHDGNAWGDGRKNKPHCRGSNKQCKTF